MRARKLIHRLSANVTTCHDDTDNPKTHTEKKESAKGSVDVSSTVLVLLKVAIIPIIVAIIALVPPILDYISNRQAERTEETHQVDNIKVNEIIYEPIEKYGYLARVVVVRAVPGSSPQTITIEHEGVNLGSRRIGSSVRDMPIDAYLKNTLQRLVVHGKITIHVDTTDGHIRNVYKAQGTKYTHIYVIKHTNEELIYIVIGFDTTAPDVLPPEVQEDIRRLVNKITNEYK